MLKQVALVGACGRMGQAIIQTLLDSKGSYNLALSHLITHAGAPQIGQELAGLPIASDELLADLSTDHTDVIIDFTPAEGFDAHLAYYQSNQIPLMIGTTGLSETQQQQLHQLAASRPVLWAANTSLGMNVLFQLVQQAAQMIGMQADIEIIEAHHRNKVDAPSGSAKVLGEIVADCLEQPLAQHAVYGRQGNTGVRSKEEIGFSTLRLGDTFGEHSVLFGLAGEQIELSHKALSRACFAKGALQAAEWLVKHGIRPGLYTMADVLKQQVPQSVPVMAPAI